MGTDSLVVLGGSEVGSVLSARRSEVVEVVRRAYIAHGEGVSILPHASALRFPHKPNDRIACLPAYLGGEWEVAGLKWIGSFPANVQKGLARASAVIVLNSMETGRPTAILEGSLISASRTAASAALAAREIHRGAIDRIGFIGTGLINMETALFLATVFPEQRTFDVFDLDPERAERFAHRLGEALGVDSIQRVGSKEEILRRSSIVSFATTALTPHVDDLSICPPGATVLHVSLRDLTPEVVLGVDNVVDDVDHVLQASTSLHLAEQQQGDHDFIRCTLAEICSAQASPRADDDAVTVFSPFGLGTLDLALTQRVVEIAQQQNLGTPLPFFPNSERGNHP